MRSISPYRQAQAFVTGTPKIVPAPSNNAGPTVYENVVFCHKEVVDVSLSSAQ
jgi:hypothetical protein